MTQEIKSMLLKRDHLCGVLRKKDIGKEVVLAGWING